MKKIRALKLNDSEIYLETTGGGLVPSAGGFVTYDRDFLSDFEVEEVEVECGIFDTLPKIIGESFEVDPTDDYDYCD
jgi:hypothetical protein